MLFDMRLVLHLLAAFAVIAAEDAGKYSPPIVLTVAGSDSGGGAGIQAALKTFEANGVFGTTAIVALTAQNTVGVQGVEAATPSFVTAQIDSVLGDIGAHAIQTGMLPTAEVIRTVARALDAHKAAVRVIDPVFVAASGDMLVSPEAIAALRNVLLPTATVLTPNMPEAGKLLDRPAPTTVAEMREAASALVALGATSVLLKGGRLAEGDMVDVYADAQPNVGLIAHDGARIVELRYAAMKGLHASAHDGARIVELRYARVETSNTHGAGCTLAAAVAAALAKQVHAGRPIDTLSAVQEAREYLSTVFEASAQCAADCR
jgi:hydroxymethylpyrimidine kinase/phosphomethylpyrimidine kinase